MLDTSGLVAAFDLDDRRHEAAARTLSAAAPPLLLSPFVTAEVEYLLGTRVGSRAQLTFLRDTAAGVYTMEPFTASDMVAAIEVLERYSDLNIGLADASVVVLAQRYNTLDILTLDERHFRTLSASGGRAFRLLPADG